MKWIRPYWHKSLWYKVSVKGTPAALDADTMTGQAFINLAQAVVTVTNRRNKEQAPTKIVEVKNS